MKIIIIGSGWYGCHISSILKKNHDVIIIEKNNSIFDNSSYYNQNRLHQGFHYCRDYNTRQLCKQNYNRFKEKYEFCIDHINNNYYIIAKDSIIDYNTFNSIYKYEKFNYDEIDNNIFNNIQGKIIKVDEHVINSDKIKKYFESELFNINIIFNCEVLSYNKINKIINVITTKGIYDCDLLLDCTYNQLELSNKEYTYELTISLVYKQIMDIEFQGLTIMDGKFCSLYPRDIENKLYTLTDVEYTPIFSSTSFTDIKNYDYNKIDVNFIKDKMEKKIKLFYPTFDKNFIYISYFLSKKTKLLSSSDSRDINIEEIDNNIYSVNCGKIYGIFEFEDYIKKYKLF